MNEFCKYPDLLVIGGSKLYGYDTPESDEDTIGFVIPPINRIVGFNIFSQEISTKEERESGNDYKIYGICKFFNNLLRNDIQSLEILFAREDKIINCSNVGKEVIKNRNLFISKSLYNRFSGYAYSEFRKVRGVAFVPEKQTTDERALIDQLRNTFCPNKKTIDAIISLLYENKPQKEVSTLGKLGKKRKDSIKKYGYSTKNAAYCIRLLLEGIEILNTGVITFPRPPQELDLLRRIRSGTKTLEEISEKFTELNSKLDDSVATSIIPEKSDHYKINDLLVRLICQRHL